MNLWRLASRPDLPAHLECTELLVDGDTEEEARKLAHDRCLTSGDPAWLNPQGYLDPDQTSCNDVRKEPRGLASISLSADGKPYLPPLQIWAVVKWIA